MINVVGDVPYMNTKQVAARLGVSRSYLEKLRVYGGGPTYIKIGRSVIYAIAEVDAWMKSHQIASNDND